MQYRTNHGCNAGERVLDCMVLWPRENQACPIDQRSCCADRCCSILFRGSLETLASVNFAPGDIIVLIAMLGWAAYNLLEVRALPNVSSISRTCLYAAAGAAFSLPLSVRKALQDPQAVFSAHAFITYLFLAVVPGIGAYGGFAFLGAKFGSVRASLVTYVLPISIVVLSILFLGEGPAVYHIVGGLLILAAVWLSVRR